MHTSPLLIEGGSTVPPLTDPDRRAAYLDALKNCAGGYENFVVFELQEHAQRWIERNLGTLKLKEIKRLMCEYVENGGEIDEVKEEREGWRDRYEFHYDLRFTINGVAIYLETRLVYRPPFKPDESEILVVNIHEP